MPLAYFVSFYFSPATFYFAEFLSALSLALRIVLPLFSTFYGKWMGNLSPTQEIYDVSCVGSFSWTFFLLHFSHLFIFKLQGFFFLCEHRRHWCCCSSRLLLTPSLSTFLLPSSWRTLRRTTSTWNTIKYQFLRILLLDFFFFTELECTAISDQVRATYSKHFLFGFLSSYIEIYIWKGTAIQGIFKF